MFDLGHVVHKVADLPAAVRDFRRLGFDVEWGADPARAHNAIVWFAEGPFVELSHVPRWVARLHPALRLARGAAVADRFRRWARSPDGFHDLALETPDTDLGPAREDLVAAGVEASRVLSGRRTRADGARVAYQFVLPRAACLPFLVSAYDPPQRPTVVDHPNGARRITRIDIDVAPGERRTVETMVSAPPGLLAPREAGSTAVTAVHVEGLRVPDVPVNCWRGGSYHPVA